MSGKITLPHFDCVSKWKEDKVIKWLKKVNLDDCIPAFEIRHIDGAKLLELNEQKLFTYQDLKIKHRKQIAKCVQECKSQASNAKRIAKTLKHNHGAQSHVESNGTCESSDYDTDDWGSDFEDESEEEVKDELNFLEVNNNNINDISGNVDKPSPTSSALSTNSSDEKSIPQPPDVPIIPKTVNGSPGFRSTLISTIPRPPIKRPPSQPPPPPIPQPTSQEPQEDYEIPIVTPSSYGKESCSSSDSLFLSSPSLLDHSNLDTYEIVEPPEENYEIVDAMPSMSFNMADKPLLPPRHSKSPESVSPPPLPQKPQKLRDNFYGTERMDGVRTFSRPKLPLKTEAEPLVEGPTPSSLPSNVGFISSLMGRRPSGTPSLSPKTHHKSKESILDSSVTSPSNGKLFSEGLSSSSGSLDRESSPSIERKKMVPLPPLPPRVPLCMSEDSIQNMATRPLPPVPVPKDEDKYSNQQDLLKCPWFQEIERGDAESAVRDLNEDGSFVVRPSKRAGAANPYSLTVLHEGKLFHLNIRLRSDGTYALGKEKEKEKTFSSVPELINFHLIEPILLKNRGESAGKTILHRYPEKT